MRDRVWWLAFGAEAGGKPRGARLCRGRWSRGGGTPVLGAVGAQRRLLPRTLAGTEELFRGEGSALFLKAGSMGS